MAWVTGWTQGPPSLIRRFRRLARWRTWQVKVTPDRWLPAPLCPAALRTQLWTGSLVTSSVFVCPSPVCLAYPVNHVGFVRLGWGNLFFADNVWFFLINHLLSIFLPSFLFFFVGLLSFHSICCCSSPLISAYSVNLVALVRKSTLIQVDMLNSQSCPFPTPLLSSLLPSLPPPARSPCQSCSINNSRVTKAVSLIMLILSDSSFHSSFLLSVFCPPFPSLPCLTGVFVGYVSLFRR